MLLPEGKLDMEVLTGRSPCGQLLPPAWEVGAGRSTTSLLGGLCAGSHGTSSSWFWQKRWGQEDEGLLGATLLPFLPRARSPVPVTAGVWTRTLQWSLCRFVPVSV